ncbi:MAG: GNAT family N-acetyltransferase [Planctomycetes bacterium]|nr:GNAT family N-acetyltransferase [Planctomycetota bacterium]
MHVKLLTQYDEVASLADTWNELAGDVPFRRWEWLGPWWRHFGHGRRLFVPVVRDEADVIVGLAPWYQETHPALGRVVRFLGSGEVCSDYLSLLTAPGKEEAVADALARWLHDQSARGLWELLELDGALNDDPAVWRLIQRLAAQGETLHRRDGLNSWRIELPETWEEHLARHAKTHRKQVRRALERIEEKRIAVHVPACSAEFEQAWGILVDLHQRRRAGLGQPGCFASQRFHDFLREAGELFLANGNLRLYWMEMEGRPIAVEFVLRGGRVDYAYQAGIEPGRLDEEPGRMMAAAMIRRAIAEGQRGFDFLRGDEPYKRQWRAEPRRLAQWRVVPQRALPQLRHSVWLAGGAMKSWLRQMREPVGPS